MVFLIFLKIRLVVWVRVHVPRLVLPPLRFFVRGLGPARVGCVGWHGQAPRVADWFGEALKDHPQVFQR